MNRINQIKGSSDAFPFHNLKHTFLLIFIFFSCQPVVGQIVLPQLISDGLILQRDQQIKIWGWASPNEKISLHFLDLSSSVEADEKGNWSYLLPPQPAGGPFQLALTGKNKVTVNDIWFGDVWICSGQSNMELNMDRVSPLYEKDIQTAEYPLIRHFKVPYQYDFHGPLDVLSGGNWQHTTPQAVRSFGAVAYFFGKALFEKYQVPIGLINTSMGGSPIESWISAEALKPYESAYQEYLKYQNDSLITHIQKADQLLASAWHEKLRWLDEGLQNGQTPWYAENVDTHNWNQMNVPGYWAQEPIGPVNGSVWFRKEIILPDDFDGSEATLWLGRIVDADETYLNGQKVGQVTYQYPPRRYKIKDGILRPGKNTIAIRVVNQVGTGGFVLDKAYQLMLKNDTLNLSGSWHFKVGATMDPLPGQTFVRWKPVGLFNGMISPLLQTSIKGVIWYQGESNTHNPQEYGRLLPTLINDWRDRWILQSDFPFLIVQLTSFLEADSIPSSSQWALLRESQYNALKIPNTAMAVTIDLGEWNDIHPLRKQEVGERLALAARHLAYDEMNLIYSGPVFRSYSQSENQLILEFDHIGSGLTTAGKSLTGFSVAGSDKIFKWANATIINNKVHVWHPDLDHPIFVRYAWADNPENANLYNKEGLPAVPFRTDQLSPLKRKP